MRQLLIVLLNNVKGRNAENYLRELGDRKQYCKAHFPRGSLSTLAP